MSQHAIRNTIYDKRHQAAFTLIELLIVVGILGILAAVTLPTIQGHIQKAKEAAAKDNLRIFRITLETLKNTGSDNLLSIDIPENPFNELSTVMTLSGFTSPENATGKFGWIYNQYTHEVRLDWPGTDLQGVRYYDY